MTLQEKKIKILVANEYHLQLKQNKINNVARCNSNEKVKKKNKEVALMTLLFILRRATLCFEIKITKCCKDSLQQYINTASLNNKMSVFRAAIAVDQPDIIIISET